MSQSMKSLRQCTTRQCVSWLLFLWRVCSTGEESRWPFIWAKRWATCSWSLLISKHFFNTTCIVSSRISFSVLSRPHWPSFCLFAASTFADTCCPCACIDWCAPPSDCGCYSPPSSVGTRSRYHDTPLVQRCVLFQASSSCICC